jgi:hypothetical protein
LWKKIIGISSSSSSSSSLIQLFDTWEEIAEPEKIVKISESENRGLWSSCVVASVFKRVKPVQSALR